MILDKEKLSEIVDRLNKATPGPWMWNFNSSYGLSGGLNTAHSGQYFVMHFERVGMHSAGPSFQKYKKYEGPVGKRGSLGMAKPMEFIKYREAHHPTFDLDIDHPDAQLIAHAPEDIKNLLELVEIQQQEIDRLKSVIQGVCDECQDKNSGNPDHCALENCKIFKAIKSKEESSDGNS